MANKRINDLTATTTLNSGDVFPLDNTTPNSRKITAANLAKAIALLQVRGALVKKSADQTTANYVTAAAVAWDAEDYDTDTIHDTVTNNTRLTVPTGVTKVKIGAGWDIGSLTANEYWAVDIRKNGSNNYNGWTGLVTASPLTSAFGSIWTPILTVVATDYFEVFFDAQTDTSVTVFAGFSWFAMEIVA